MRVAGFVSSLHRTPARTCSHIQHPTQLSPASLILCCQLVHGWRPSCWKLVWLFQQLLQFMQYFVCRVAQHHPWLGHSFSMSYCVAYSFDLLDFRCNTVPLTRILDIMLTRHHFYRYTMQSSFIPASIMRACGAQIGSRTIVFNYHYRSRLFLSCERWSYSDITHYWIWIFYNWHHSDYSLELHVPLQQASLNECCTYGRSHWSLQVEIGEDCIVTT